MFSLVLTPRGRRDTPETRLARDLDFPGLYAYKWQGKHYVYKDAGNLYHSSLGNKLVSKIPSNPYHYRFWLLSLRTKYSAIAKTIERALTISTKKIKGNTYNMKAYLQSQGLHCLPSYFIPEYDRQRKWAYVIDLDREIFGISGVCFFHLSKIPPHFKDLMEEAQDYWLGNVGKDEIHDSITTNDPHTIPWTHDPTPAYLHMKRTTIRPKQQSALNHKPAFVACERLYKHFLNNYETQIRQAQEFHIESNFPFREFIFALMCFASCSPSYVRLIRNKNMIWDRLERWVHGVMVDNDGVARERKEIITGFLEEYHPEGMEAGSAPKAASYWFSGSLVYLRRDITSRERFHDAILAAIAKGKAEGHAHFNAIIISLKYFILLKFSEGNVQHTKRLKLGACPELKKEKLLTFKNDLNPCTITTNEHQSVPKDARISLSNKNAQDDSDDGDWVEDADIATFAVLAHFFDATQKQQLRPSTMYNAGVFPNELYEKILQHADMETNIACRQVSRSFRTIVSETFFLDREVRLVCHPGKEPQCFHDTHGLEECFTPTPRTSFGFGIENSWTPVIGFSDGSASVETKTIVEFPAQWVPGFYGR